jgi:hypothetical protein
MRERGSRVQKGSKVQKRNARERVQIRFKGSRVQGFKKVQKGSRVQIGSKVQKRKRGFK